VSTSNWKHRIAETTLSSLLGLMCLSAHAQDTAQKTVESPDAARYASAVGEAAHWGQAMYDNDQAAWKATDIVLERTSKVSREKIRGWITEPGEHGIRVVFVGEQDGHAVGLYESTPSQADFVVDSPARTLDADELAQFTARQTAKAAQSGGCSDRYNAVVLPDGTGSDRKWRAYLIPATEDPDAIPIGGYFRYYISADGKTVLSQRAFTKSCLMSSRKLSPKGGHLVGVLITHMLDPQPTEAHVFVSLTYKTHIWVSTRDNHLVWYVDGCTIKGYDEEKTSAK